MDQPPVYEGPDLTKSCTNPEPGGYGHKTSLGKAWGGGGPLQRMTHRIMVYSPTQSEKQKTEK